MIFQKWVFYSTLVDINEGSNNCLFLKININKAIEYKLKSLGYTDIDLNYGKVKGLERMLAIYAHSLIICGEEKEGERIMILAAKYGHELAIEYCRTHYLNYGVSFSR
jgi:hypothetical protein